MYNLSNTHATIHSVHSLNQICSLKKKQFYFIFSYTLFLHDIQMTPYFSLSVYEVTHPREMKDVWLLAPPSGDFKKKTCTWGEMDTLIYFFTFSK